jgi:farnesyl-diphosphate farnesyltransferase
MGAVNWIALLLTHPFEFRTLIQFWLYHEQKRDIAAQKEHPTSGWDRASMRRCWEFLDMTSRSFSAVIKELEGDLARTVSKRAFYTSSFGAGEAVEAGFL